MAVAELFRALGDPIRLEMVGRLATGDPQTIGSLSKGLNITRQGARKHLQVLAEANVVHLKSQGRDTGVYLDRQTLEIGERFIAELERRWDMRLEALRKYVEDDQFANDIND